MNQRYYYAATDVGAVIFELALSERDYAAQSFHEYVTVVMAAALAANLFILNDGIPTYATSSQGMASSQVHSNPAQ